LVERPRLDHGLLRKHITLHPLHRQLIEGYLSRKTAASKWITRRDHLTIRVENIAASTRAPWAQRSPQP
jgi:hypothetical protein